MKVIICPADGAPYISEIDGSLKSMQDVVGGHIETFYYGMGAIIICNEEGKLIGLPENNSLPMAGFNGDCLICYVSGDGFVGLPEAKAKLVLARCKLRWQTIWEEKHGL